MIFDRFNMCIVQIVTAWNGFAIGALAAASRALKSEDPPLGRLFPVEGRDPADYRQAAVKVGTSKGLPKKTLGDCTVSLVPWLFAKAMKDLSLLLPLGVVTSPSMQHAKDGVTASLAAPISAQRGSDKGCHALGSNLTQI